MYRMERVRIDNGLKDETTNGSNSYNKIENINTNREVWIIKERNRANHELPDFIKTFLGESRC